MTRKTLLCLGFGYSARRIAQRLAARGWRVLGTVRSTQSADKLRALGFEAIVFDGEQPSRILASAFGTASHLLVSVPPGQSGDPVLRWHAEDLLKAEGLSWIGYLSTIGVYGDHRGAWVDEETPPRPQSSRSVRRLVAEEDWLEIGHSMGVRTEIFRLAGIYGPGRSAIDSLRAGTARRIVKPGQLFNRIHVDDIASVVISAIDKPTAHHIFNVTDDEPAPPQDVIAYAARLLGLPPPPEQPFDAAELSPMARSFYEESKRVSNRRLYEVLGVSLAFPTYREGLQAIALACGVPAPGPTR